MSMPARDAEWKVIVKYFTDNRAEGEGLGVVLKRASAYKNGNEAPKTADKTMKKTAKKMGKKGGKRRGNKSTKKY
jgi:hypothetical protein